MVKRYKLPAIGEISLEIVMYRMLTITKKNNTNKSFYFTYTYSFIDAPSIAL